MSKKSSEILNDCNCCDRCNAGPCGGSQQGSFCDDLCFCDDEDREDEWCANCSNTGSVSCHCGGDMCICSNAGSEPCWECS